MDELIASAIGRLIGDGTLDYSTINPLIDADGRVSGYIQIIDGNPIRTFSLHEITLPADHWARLQHPEWFVNEGNLNG